MNAIYIATALGLWLLYLAALTTIASRWVPGFATARAVGVLVLTLVCFCLEHIAGWGSLRVLWPVLTVAAVAVLYRERARLQESRFWRAELVFVVLVGYSLWWRVLFPSIYPTAEHVTDLYFISNYLSGATLPPLDGWYPPKRFDFYYALQHYGAALGGRVLGLSPGLCYNLAFALVMGVGAALIWEFAGFFLQQRWARALVLAAAVIGGTGATAVVPLVHQSDADDPGTLNMRMWGSARFIGTFDKAAINTEKGRELYLPDVPPGFERRDLPLENFGYQNYVGDYHPPLGSFGLLLLALCLIAMIETGRGNTRINTALLGLTVTATVATNTWVLPLHGLLVAGWAVWRGTDTRTDWRALIGGGLAGLVLLHPFLIGFATHGSGTSFKLVSGMEHTPWLSGLTLFWPVLLMLVVAATVPGRRNLALRLAVLFGLLLLVSEFVYVDDPSGAQFERTNTTMKWWGWLWTGALVTLGTLGMASQSRWRQALVVVALAVPSLYLVTTLRYWGSSSSEERGQLAGDFVYTRDPVLRGILQRLAIEPEGIVMENVRADAYVDGAVLAALTAKPAVLGWPSHLGTWHGNVSDAWDRRDALRAFYAGNLSEARDWLAAQQVRYIVWKPDDAQNLPAFARWRAELAPDYHWLAFSPVGAPPAGMWIRR